MKMPMEFVNALQVGRFLVAETDPTEPSRRAWVEIRPHKDELDRQAARERWKRSVAGRTFTVRLREFDKTYIQNNWDVAPGEGMWELRRVEVIGEEALEELLDSWSVPGDDLRYPDKSDYPF